MTEIKIYVDNDYADRLEKQSHDESHQLIKEFMLGANEAVARVAETQPLPVHLPRARRGEDEKLQELRETMGSYGVKCGNLPRPTKWAPCSSDSKTTAGLHTARACPASRRHNTASPDGHYGLAKQDYTHFTSPIRRYSDLIVHRVFDAYLHKTKAESAPEQPDIKYTQGNSKASATISVRPSATVSMPSASP